MKKITSLHNITGRNHGFTLIEVIVAILLLTVALLGLVSLTTMAIKGNAFNKTSSTATTLAKDKMEELKSMAYTAIPAGPTTDNWAADGITAGSYFTRTWSATLGTGTKTITITVSWPPSRTVELKTIRATD